MPEDLNDNILTLKTTMLIAIISSTGAHEICSFSETPNTDNFSMDCWCFIIIWNWDFGLWAFFQQGWPPHQKPGWEAFLLRKFYKRDIGQRNSLFKNSILVIFVILKSKMNNKK